MNTSHQTSDWIVLGRYVAILLGIVRLVMLKKLYQQLTISCRKKYGLVCGWGHHQCV